MTVHPKTNKLLPIALLIVIGLFTNTGCYYDVENILYPPSEICDTLDISYSSDILPIIDLNCLVCHNQSSALGDIVLEPHPELQNYALNGNLLCSIEHISGCSEMPKNASKLLECDIEKIKIWVNEGALEN